MDPLNQKLGKGKLDKAEKASPRDGGAKATSLRRAEALGQELRQRGHRLTSARQAILDGMVSSGGHLTADELAEEARIRAPGVGRMTVYRTLELLCDLGLIRPVYQGTGAARYILLEDGRHHHLVCSQCDRVLEFEECLIEDIEGEVAGRYGFDVRGHMLEMYGVCDRCRGEEEES